MNKKEDAKLNKNAIKFHIFLVPSIGKYKAGIRMIWSALALLKVIFDLDNRYSMVYYADAWYTRNILNNYENLAECFAILNFQDLAPLKEISYFNMRFVVESHRSEWEPNPICLFCEIGSAPSVLFEGRFMNENSEFLFYFCRFYANFVASYDALAILE